MQVMKWSVIALAVAAGTTQMAVASSQSESKGFIEDSSLNLHNKNYFFHRDFRNNSSDRQNYRNEWAHGISTTFESGFTEGTVGFGVDAHGMLGLKLDSGKGTTGTGLLPQGSDGRADDDYSYAGGAVKLRVSNTVLKYGDLMPTAPVFATGTARLFPGSATGFQLLSSEIEGLNIDAGHFTAIRDGSASTNSDGEITLAYGGTATKTADYIGGSYAVNDNLSVSLYGSELEDIWRQYYSNVNYTIPFSDTQSLNLDFNIYRTTDKGNANAGEIDTTAFSMAAAYSIGAHKITLAHQRINGDEAFDYIAMDGGNAGDSIFLNNSVQYSDFNGANEKSWQLRYDLNMAEFGVPGLSFMARYITGSDVDGTKADPNGPYAGLGGEDGKEWERDLEVKYVVQEGAAKDLSFRVRHATWRANNDMAGFGSGGATALDEVRLITEYPLDIL
ncbi:outer membrane porin, OprD family [Pseudomonas sp. HMWF032]|uniref:OprD family porin n=1 Tax=Pseudomonas sp. HMWF032 TaxID=2056866 RepID=UPI000D3C8316|nr:OprD family porin [Pseudomonas sp. HMWF032]PTS84112.1 outer membrane porin, OprD family [Pseudomonas sp. HMWF032]PTT78801.1 outer membrane porin, OprD family [Pseudomonas sp. HMWF010]